MVLALDGRPLHLLGATKLMLCQLSMASRARLGVSGEATTTVALMAAYRRVRYLFHRVLSVMDPSGEPRSRRLSPERCEELRKEMAGRPARGWALQANASRRRSKPSASCFAQAQCVERHSF